MNAQPMKYEVLSITGTATSPLLSWGQLLCNLKHIQTVYFCYRLRNKISSTANFH